MAITYSKIRKMRELIIAEIQSQFPTMTVQHYLLAEERLQTALMAGFEDTQLLAARNEWKDKQP